MDKYIVKAANGPVSFEAGWDSPLWQSANEAKLDFLLRKGSDNQPDTRIRMLYDDQAIYGFFQVKDRFVKAVARKDQDMVCRDSCVEFFVKPVTDDRYFNFEMNCGGTLLLYHALECKDGMYDVVPQEDLDTIGRFHTMPHIIDDEITVPTTWYLGFRIPVSFFVKYSKIDPKLKGQIWHANFTKCADATSGPHWLTWQPLPKFSFHLPECFGELCFE